MTKPLIIHGRSLGGGVASWAANNVECDALILESTFTSVPDMGAHYYPFLPIGGFKQSGIARETGDQGIKTYSQIKSIIVNK